MATDADYQQRIAGYDHAKLLDLWQKIKAGDTPDWDPGKALEYLILRAFQLEGAEIEWPYKVTDDEGEVLEQIDGAIFVDQLACVVEAKDYKKDLDVQPIAKMRNQLLRRPARTLGLVFSRKGFTGAANALARFLSPQTILLWQGKEIELVLKEKTIRPGLMTKYRYAVTHGWPDFNLVSPE
jgi:hypothetical protein